MKKNTFHTGITDLFGDVGGAGCSPELRQV